jgi:hypothetical protein
LFSETIISPSALLTFSTLFDPWRSSCPRQPDDLKVVDLDEEDEDGRKRNIILERTFSGNEHDVDVLDSVVVAFLPGNHNRTRLPPLLSGKAFYQLLQ